MTSLHIGDIESWKETIWNALEKYRESIPEGIKENDEEWNDICTAMAWIDESLNELEDQLED